MQLLFIVLLALSPLPTERVTQVYDGDTITIGKSEKVRLMCIDTPEIRNNSHGNADTINAIKSRDYLRSLILGQDVTVVRYGKDYYKRTLARIYLKDGREVNQIMVEQKMAVKYLSNKCHWQ